jgi:hypothetical protein
MEDVHDLIVFSPVLTHCCTCIIHQSMPYSPPMAAVRLDRRGSGGLRDKAVFCDEVSFLSAVSPSHFVLSTSSNPLLHLYHTSIDVAINKGCSNGLGVA